MNNSPFIIVEKKEIRDGKTRDLCALCADEKTQLTPRFSLAFEGYISEWTEDRIMLEGLIADSQKAAQTT